MNTKTACRIVFFDAACIKKQSLNTRQKNLQKFVKSILQYAIDITLTLNDPPVL